MAVEYAWNPNTLQWVPLTATAPSPTVDPYGIHVITWDGTNWWYRGAITTTRPSGIAPYLEGGYAVWNTALDITFNTPPLLAIPGDGWLRHGGAQI